MVDWNKILSCTIDERKSTIKYIEDLINVKYDIEKYGIHTLIDYVKPHSSQFEKIAVWMVINGYSSELCRDVLFRILNLSCLDQEQYMRGVIFLEFLLTLQKETIGVQELKVRMLSYLGPDFMLEICVDDLWQNADKIIDHISGTDG